MSADPILKSKRLLAAFLTVMALLLGFFGIDFDEQTQQMILGQVEAIVAGVLAVVAVVAGIHSKYSEWKKRK